MSELDRIRWRCRRGLLELDLILTHFLDKRFDTLTEHQKEKFAQLINNSDNDLWDLISNRQSCKNHDLREIIQLLQ
ncbi:MAG: succinate dehydrogenase assembly factor 2 [Burkholderiales bacterium]